MGKIDELLNDYISNGEFTPGISLAIVKNGEAIYKMSHGYANLENAVKINSKTAFYIASLSKSFTAAAIALLYEKGKLALSDKINNYFTDLPDYCKDIKIANLLNHTSGLKDYFDSYFEEKKNINFITNNDVYNFVLQGNSLNFPVGDKFEYSNTGYVLLSLLVEKVSGQSFSEFLNENFFVPLGMKNTYVFTEDRPIVPNRAYGYQENNGNFFGWDYYVLTTGDGGIYSCIDDLILWIQAFDNESIFTKQTIEMIFSREKLNNGSPCKYGFGWFTLEKDNKKVEFHAGQLGGFTNIMINLREEKFSIIILTNYFRNTFQKIFKAVHDCATEANIIY